MNYPAFQSSGEQASDGGVGAMKHLPVLLQQSVHGLNIKPDGVYLDATFGRGGHSRSILGQLSDAGVLWVLDRDPEAIVAAKRLAQEDARVRVLAGTFSDLDDLLGEDVRLDGALFDLGVSSPQLDQGERGFSFQKDGPLDMRMNNAQGQSAADWLARADRDEIIWVLTTYGEESCAAEVADRVIQTRLRTPIATTKDLVDVILAALPRMMQNKHPATKIFQAIRMHVNAEFDEIQRGLPMAAMRLRSGGRLVVISYHSLEHKHVSDALKRAPSQTEYTDSTSKLPKLKKVGHAIKADHQEVSGNRRARSALLRTWEAK